MLQDIVTEKDYQLQNKSELIEQQKSVISDLEASLAQSQRKTRLLKFGLASAGLIILFESAVILIK